MFTRIFLRQRPFLAGLIILFGAILFLDLPGAHLFDPDETRYAEIPREMLAHQDWLTFRLNDSRYFEKPPLLYWLNATSMSLLGETPFAARLAVRLACIGTVLLIIGRLGTTVSPLGGLWGGLIFISSLLPFALGRINLTDGVVSFFLTLTLFGVMGFFRERAAGRPGTGFQWLVGFAAALAMLSKGLLALVLPGLVLLPWTLLTGRWKHLRDLLLSWAPVLFFMIVVPSFYVIEKHNPGFLHFFIIREHFQRYSTDIHDRTGHILYFVPIFVGGLLPWTFIFIGQVYKHFTAGEAQEKWQTKGLPLVLGRARIIQNSEELFLFLWCVTPILFFSFSHSKLIPYILPAFPAAAALLGRWISEVTPQDVMSSQKFWIWNALLMTGLVGVGGWVGLQAEAVVTLGLERSVGMMLIFILFGAWLAFYFSRKSVRRALFIQGVAWWGLLFVLVRAIPTLAKDYSSMDMARAAQKVQNATLVAYRTYPHGFPWALKKPILVADFKGELASDGIKDPQLFIGHEEFWKRWNSEEHLLVVFAIRGTDNSMDHFRDLTTRLHEIAKNHRHMLAANFKESRAPYDGATFPGLGPQ
ncbi:MAG: Undecaprenyl phosphate-alpha-4-amino-4-deoxy-L-arabinose arabinosyl transferase [Elusimicrobia bacterium]|nr:Undecaprenyl phosphate-alpha-4-amino-4-deoxy-L-arabinose arabinosyl transferase [Elusimicrobiota bacterium]